MRTLKRTVVVMILLGAGALPGVASHNEHDHSPNVRQLMYEELDWPPPRNSDARGVYIRDLAFTGRLIVGSVQGGHAQVYSPNDVGESGLAVFRINPTNTAFEQIGTFRCHSLDVVNAWGDLVFEGSVETTQTGTTGDATDPCDRDGLRIIDISDPKKPKQAAFLDVHCGVGPHALMPWRDRLYIYAPSTCREETDNPFAVAPLSELTVFRVYPEAPEASRVVRSDNILPMGGCDRFVVHTDRKLAACAGDVRFGLFDLSDPAHPTLIDGSMTTIPPSTGGWPHLAVSWDGSYLAVGLGTYQPYRTGTETTIRIYNIEDVTNPVAVSEWSAPVIPGTDGGVKGLSFIPTKDGRQVLSVSHGSLGFHLLDVTDAANPGHLAHYTATPPAAPTEETPKFTSLAAYWYNGRFLLTNGRFLRMLRIDGFDRRTVHHFRRGYNPFTVLSDFARTSTSLTRG